MKPTPQCSWRRVAGAGLLAEAPVTAPRREGPCVPSVGEGHAGQRVPASSCWENWRTATSATTSRRVPCSPKTLMCSFVGREGDSPGCLLSLPGPLWLVVRTRFPEASGLVCYQHGTCPGGEVWLSGLWPRGPLGLGMGFSEPPPPPPAGRAACTTEKDQILESHSQRGSNEHPLGSLLPPENQDGTQQGPLLGRCELPWQLLRLPLTLSKVLTQAVFPW